MGFLRYASALTAVLFSVFLYNRSNVLYSFYANAPSRLPHINNIGDFKIRFKPLVRNCEDVYLSDKDGWALLSCDPGRDEWNTVMGTFINSAAPPETGLYLYKYGEGDDAKPEKLSLYPAIEDPNDFHPLGIEVHEESRSLFVANHAFSGSRIDMYKLNVKANFATFVGSITDPEHLPTPNSIAAISEDEFFVTNDHYIKARDNLLAAKIESYGGWSGGTIAYVKLGEKNATGKTLTRMPMANGIALLNATTLAVASSNTMSVRLFEIEKNSTTGIPKLNFLKSISVPFLADNLSVDSKGKLLIAGHPHAPSLEKAAKLNGLCQKKTDAKTDQCKFEKPSWIAEWSEEDGVKTLYSGSEFGTSTTAVRDWERGVGFGTGLYERGLLTWKL